MYLILDYATTPNLTPHVATPTECHFTAMATINDICHVTGAARPTTMPEIDGQAFETRWGGGLGSCHLSTKQDQLQQKRQVWQALHNDNTPLQEGCFFFFNFFTTYLLTRRSVSSL
jgi:hypothetical protein